MQRLYCGEERSNNMDEDICVKRENNIIVEGSKVVTLAQVSASVGTFIFRKPKLSRRGSCLTKHFIPIRETRTGALEMSDEDTRQERGNR